MTADDSHPQVLSMRQFFAWSVIECSIYTFSISKWLDRSMHVSALNFSGRGSGYELHFIGR